MPGLLVLAKFKFKAKHDDKYRWVVIIFVAAFVSELIDESLYTFDCREITSLNGNNKKKIQIWFRKFVFNLGFSKKCIQFLIEHLHEMPIIMAKTDVDIFLETLQIFPSVRRFSDFESFLFLFENNKRRLEPKASKVSLHADTMSN